MKMIDDYVDTLIKTDEKGNRVFLPHDVFTRGKIIPSEQVERELKQYLRQYTGASLMILIPSGMMMMYLCHDYGPKTLLIFAFLVLLFLAHYQVRINRILKGAQTLDVRLTYDEVAITTCSTGRLWFLVICFGSVLLLFAGVVYCEPAWESIVRTLSMGAIWLAFLMLLIKKRKSKGADSPTTASV